MIRKLLLVSANQLSIPYPVYPLGISYLTTYLRNKLANFDIRVFDFIDKSYDKFIVSLKDFQPDYICVSLRNIDDVNIYKQESFIEHYKTIVEKTRETDTGKIILGGAGFSIFPELLFRLLKPDFGIYGEGEECLYSLICALERNSDYSDINSLLYLKKDKVIFNKKTQSLKTPDLHFEQEWINYYWQHSGMLNIQTKRGCPYKCIYCTYPLIEGNNVRTFDIDKIIDTLTDLSENKKIDYIFFTDSVFNISKDFNEELAKKIINKKLQIKWGAYFNFCNLDEKTLNLYKRAGLRHIEFGTESLSDITLHSYNKPFRVADILEISDLCVKTKIDYAHFLILGGYGETEKSLEETFENSKKINHSVFFPFIGMRIYPGTQLQRIAVQENIMSKNDDMLKPVYYLSKNIDISTLKNRAQKTGKRWIFPDDDLSTVMNKMRAKNKKGPLWEYLIQ